MKSLSLRVAHPIPTTGPRSWPGRLCRRTYRRYAQTVPDRGLEGVDSWPLEISRSPPYRARSMIFGCSIRADMCRARFRRDAGREQPLPVSRRCPVAAMMGPPMSTSISQRRPLLCRPQRQGHRVPQSGRLHPAQSFAEQARRRYGSCLYPDGHSPRRGPRLHRRPQSARISRGRRPTSSVNLTVEHRPHLRRTPRCSHGQLAMAPKSRTV